MVSSFGTSLKVTERRQAVWGGKKEFVLGQSRTESGPAIESRQRERRVEIIFRFLVRRVRFAGRRIRSPSWWLSGSGTKGGGALCLSRLGADGKREEVVLLFFFLLHFAWRDAAPAPPALDSVDVPVLSVGRPTARYRTVVLVHVSVSTMGVHGGARWWADGDSSF